MADLKQYDDTIEHMLTTIDNPFDPFTEYDEWTRYDEDAGYHTPSLLARVARTSDDLSEADQSIALENAIFEIISENVDGIYKRVARSVQDI